jgi:hypothetical protein
MYTIQKVRSFKINYNKNLQALRNKNAKSGYFQQILNTEHCFCGLGDTLQLLNIEHKSPYLNTL